jgi:hypothetical protein
LSLGVNCVYYQLESSIFVEVDGLLISGSKTFFASVNWKYLESGSEMPGNGLMLHIP